MFTKDDSKVCKGMAILLLLFHHLFYNEKRVASSGLTFGIISYDTVRVLAIMARICVWIFVFISAYGLTYSYEHLTRERTIRFVPSRWFALLSQFTPVFFLACIFLTLFGIDVFGRYEGNVLYILLDALAVSDLFSTPTLSGVYWYMCFAQVIVVLIPIVSLFCKRIPLTAGMPLLFCVIQYLPKGIASPSGGEYINYLACIMLGCYMYYNDKFFLCPESKKQRWYLFTLDSVIAILLLISEYKVRLFDVWHMRSFLSAFSAMFICRCISLVSNDHGVVNRLLINLGIHSGNMFLCHAFLYNYFPKILYWSRSPLFAYLTLVVLSYLISCCIEVIEVSSGYRRMAEGVRRHISNA